MSVVRAHPQSTGEMLREYQKMQHQADLQAVLRQLYNVRLPGLGQPQGTVISAFAKTTVCHTTESRRLRHQPVCAGNGLAGGWRVS